MRKLASLLFLLPVALTAQTLQIILPQQCVWRAGDDLRWSSPVLDETGWLPWSNWNASREPHLWVRCKADLSSLKTKENPAVQIELYAAYQLYLDGRVIGSAGDLGTGAFTMNIVREWPVSGSLASPAVLALRVTRRVASTVPVGHAPPLAIYTGSFDLLKNQRSALILSQVVPRVLPAVCCCMVGILGFVLLPLWFNDPARRELLLLAISCVGLPFIYLDYVAASTLLSFPVSVYFLVWALPAAIVNVTRALFPFALADRRVPLFFWVLIAVGNGLYLPSIILPLLPAAQSLALDSIRSNQLEAIGDVFRALENLAPFVAFLPWSRVTRRMKPLAVLTMMWGAVMMAFFSVRITGTHLPGIPDLQQRWGNAVASIENVTILCLVSALLLLLFREQQQTARERAILSGEMQAAQQVQGMLASAVLNTVPGMRVEVAFHPIREVGGDFYSCRILPGNRQRILLGDVSGKGAAAAMTAAVLLGAAQRRDHDHPAELLDHLNSVLADMRLGGFATCLCAELSAEGALIVANAGHLPPYLNGEEIPLECGVPLSITPDVRYTESAVCVAQDEQLTFLSDGVVEAQNNERELFGFDRTRQISTQSAEAIARAAQQFGQEDDITVLTLTFAGAEAIHA
ncbi:MAG: serine/threonine-protein phosphatase [Acidobacteria bacterium]|nr:serine/threonine-protein phosphatase [Acidobacteriota bacterium]